MAFMRAERKKAKARIGICGAAGSGKTWGALELGFGIGGKIAVIDTEHGSAELYAEHGEYDVAQIRPPYTVQKYIDLIKEAEKEYDIIIIDSLTHAWAGEGGLLDQQGKIADSGRGNGYTAWRQITPMHNQLIDTMLQSPAHIIATMRSKTEYIVEQDSRGKSVPKKVGMAPVQRDGMDYEFTIVFDVDQAQHVAMTSKDRTNLFNGFCQQLTKEHGKQIHEWLESGAEDKREEQVALFKKIKASLDGAMIAGEAKEIWEQFKDELLTLPDAGREKLEIIYQSKVGEPETQQAVGE